jgi:hypothetical protein
MVAPTCFGITLPYPGRVPSAFWEILNWGAVNRILWMGVLCLVAWCVHWMNNCCICWFFTYILLGILIFKWLTARRLCKSFGVKGLMLIWRYSVARVRDGGYTCSRVMSNSGRSDGEPYGSSSKQRHWIPYEPAGSNLDTIIVINRRCSVLSMSMSIVQCSCAEFAWWSAFSHVNNNLLIIHNDRCS